jgi:hypothetical protein
VGTFMENGARNHHIFQIFKKQANKKKKPLTITKPKKTSIRTPCHISTLPLAPTFLVFVLIKRFFKQKQLCNIFSGRMEI